MTDLFTQICTNASKLINSREFLERSRIDDKCFTRKRKMGFTSIVCFVLNLLTRTLQIELDDFTDRVIGRTGSYVTKQAFSKARKNIKWQAFEELFQLGRNLVLNSPALKTYRGFRVLAVDGSELRMGRTPETERAFGKRSREAVSRCRAQISMLTDVVNGFIIAADIDSIYTSERTLASRHFKEFEHLCTKNDILLFDRGYPSKGMLEKLSQMGCKYLMRVQKSSFKGSDAAQSDDCYIKIPFHGCLYNVRLVRLALPDGETEVLITNLGRRSFKKADFMELYGMRWGIETKYNTIKNKIMAEKFSGKTELSVRQEFFAALFLCNCASAISLTVEDEIALKKQNCKYEYKPNNNLIIGYLKHRLPRILLSVLSERLVSLCKEVLCLALKQPVPVKPGRSFKRPAENHHRKAGIPKYPV